jgi:hypothetical protein
MSIDHIRRALTTSCIGTLVALAVVPASAQQWGWGENAAVCGPCIQCNNGQCGNGHCCPSQPWGYYQTNWHQWPGAIYPDMVKPAPQNGSEIPPGQVDVPPTGKEADIQTPTPGRESGKNPNYGAPGPSGSPRPSAEGPSDLLPLKESAPSDQPLVIPPPTEPGGALPGRSGSLPRARGATANLGSTGSIQERDGRNQSQSRWRDDARQTSTAAVNNARLRSANPSFVRATSPESEPDLFVPSLSAKQIANSNGDLRARRSADVRTIDARSQTNNPLRSDWGPELATPVTLVDAEPAINDSDRAISTSTSASALRSNPLRRN